MNSSSTSASVPTSPILLQSHQGGELLHRATTDKNVNNRMIQIYNENRDQRTEIYSVNSNKVNDGIASLILLINAMNVAYRIKYMQGEKINEKNRASGLLRVNKNDILSSQMVRDYMTSRSINEDKLTLQQLRNIALYLGFGANTHFAYTINSQENTGIRTEIDGVLGENAEYSLLKGVEKFRSFARDYITRPVTGMIVNFKGGSNAGSQEGQFGAIAGYDDKADRVLVLPGSSISPPQWILLENLFESMTSVDSNSGLPGGLLHVHELLY